MKLKTQRVNSAATNYFPPIFMQSGGSCGQASGIAYAFTYEIDLARNVSATLPENQYPTHFTWDFLNGGVGGGSWYFDGWDIVKDNGCPNIPTYGGMDSDDTVWMTGFDKYVSGMHNRVVSYAQITDANTPAGLFSCLERNPLQAFPLEALKNYLVIRTITIYYDNLQDGGHSEPACGQADQINLVKKGNYHEGIGITD